MERKHAYLPADAACPDSMSELEWLAAQSNALIDLSKELFRQIRPYCTEKSCKKMIAGKYEYQWKHHARTKRPRSYPAQSYMRMMFQWMVQQKHIYEMEQLRHQRIIKELLEPQMLMYGGLNATCATIVADYLHDPFYYLAGIWAKAFSVFAHVFCQHFGDDLAEETKVQIESAFERFLIFVKGYRILSSRRLAPLEDRIERLSLALPVSAVRKARQGNKGGEIEQPSDDEEEDNKQETKSMAPPSPSPEPLGMVKRGSMGGGGGGGGGGGEPDAEGEGEGEGEAEGEGEVEREVRATGGGEREPAEGEERDSGAEGRDSAQGRRDRSDTPDPQGPGY